MRETEIQTIQRKVRKFTDLLVRKNEKVTPNLISKDFSKLTSVCPFNSNCLCFPAATGETRQRSRYSDDPKKGKRDV